MASFVRPNVFWYHFVRVFCGVLSMAISTSSGVKVSVTIGKFKIELFSGGVALPKAVDFVCHWVASAVGGVVVL